MLEFIQYDESGGMETYCNGQKPLDKDFPQGSKEWQIQASFDVHLSNLILSIIYSVVSPMTRVSYLEIIDHHLAKLLEIERDSG